MKLAWLYWEADYADDETQEEIDEGKWVFKEEYEDWRGGKWKRIVYCEVEDN